MSQIQSAGQPQLTQPVLESHVSLFHLCNFYFSFYGTRFREVPAPDGGGAGFGRALPLRPRRPLPDLTETCTPAQDERLFLLFGEYGTPSMTGRRRV